MAFAEFLAIAVLVSLFVTYLIKRFTHHQTFFVISVIKTERFNPVFDRLRKSRLIEHLAVAGSILGFGAFGFDFFIGRKFQSRLVRILSFLIVTLLLGGAFGVLFGGFLENNALLENQSALPYQAAFGLGGFSFGMLYALFAQALQIGGKLLLGEKTCPGVAPVIPGVEIPNVPIFIPVEAWISLLVILVIHESSHGFLARRHHIPVKSSGVLLFGPAPIGAFVEPDEEKIKTMDDEQAVQIFAAGPTSNIVSMLVVLVLSLGVVGLVLTPLLSPMMEEIAVNQFTGVRIVQIDQNFTFCQTVYPSPAFEAGIPPGSLLLSINGTDVKSPAEAQMALAQNRGEPKTFGLEFEGSRLEKNLSPNELGRFGIRLEGIQNPDYEVPSEFLFWQSIISPVASVVFWFIVLSVLVAASNFLPLVPFDGGRMAELIFAPYLTGLQMSTEDTRRLVKRIFMWVLWPIIFVNALPLIL